MIVETFGGIAPQSRAYVRRLAARAKGARAQLSCEYEHTPESPMAFSLQYG